MFIEDFSPSAALAAASCPRCHAVGLVEIDSEVYSTTPPANRHQAPFIVAPSIPARCPACGLVMEWPGCCE